MSNGWPPNGSVVVNTTCTYIQASVWLRIRHYVEYVHLARVYLHVVLMRDIAIGAKETLICKTIFPNLVTTLAPLQLRRYQTIQLVLVLGTQLLTETEVVHNMCNIHLYRHEPPLARVISSSEQQEARAQNDTVDPFHR